MTWLRDLWWKTELWWLGVRERHRAPEEDTEWFWRGIEHEGGNR